MVLPVSDSMAIVALAGPVVCFNLGGDLVRPLLELEAPQSFGPRRPSSGANTARLAPTSALVGRVEEFSEDGAAVALLLAPSVTLPEDPMTRKLVDSIPLVPVPAAAMAVLGLAPVELEGPLELDDDCSQGREPAVAMTVLGLPPMEPVCRCDPMVSQTVGNDLLKASSSSESSRMHSFTLFRS